VENGNVTFAKDIMSENIGVTIGPQTRKHQTRNFLRYKMGNQSRNQTENRKYNDEIKRDRKLTIIYKTLHRTYNIWKQEPHNKHVVNSGNPKR